MCIFRTCHAREIQDRRECGVAKVVMRGPEAIRGPANIYHVFFFVFSFPQERFLACGAFSSSFLHMR